MAAVDLVWAVVVARVGDTAKSRLAVALTPDERRQLALAMLSDVLTVSGQVNEIDGVVAVVDGPAASELARPVGAVVVQDPGGGDMNAAVRAGIREAVRRGAHTVMVLPGDIPSIASNDLETLLAEATAAKSVVIGASRDGQGTNALLLRPPDVIQPAFGPPSAERHAQRARHANAHVRTIYHLGLALDVDTPADLAALADAPVGPHTADVLAQLMKTRAETLSRF